MPYTLKVDGMAEISETLEKLDKQAPAVAAKALYEGAAVMQKAIFKAIDSIKTAPFKYAKGGEQRLPSPEEKEILQQAGIGVAKFDKNGVEIDTSVGFNQSGYADVNWNHMNSGARTNYKAVSLKGHDSNASSFLRTIRYSGKAEQYGLSSNIGRGAQNQKPINVIANAINSGTSFMKKQPFIRKGVSKGKKAAVAAMVSAAEKMFNAIISQNEAGGKSA